MNHTLDPTFGNTKTERGHFFHLYSENAERVELCLFDPSGYRELSRIPMNRSENRFFLEIQKDLTNHCYGYRVFGPWEPHNGHRFNPNKLLLDPYAKEIRGALIWNPAIYGYIPDSENPDQDLVFNPQDSAPFVPKSIIRESPIPLRNLRPPSFPKPPKSIYEMHVKGFSMEFPGIKDCLRGTYDALCEPRVIEHWKKLGIQTLEFLPVHYFIDQPFQLERGLSNYWGYNTLNFFMPHPSYAKNDSLTEFQLTVANLKNNGFQIVLDVVYNHTAEGDQYGPHLCYRGIDNKVYYGLQENQRFYRNDSGCGNILNFQHPIVQKLTEDSLDYWHRIMGVDGFRFDLASISKKKLPEENEDFFEKLDSHPRLKNTIRIAEPWDVTFEGRKVGEFFNCYEWTDLFRDRVRRFWRGDQTLLGEFAQSFSGVLSEENTDHQNFPFLVNFITCHDGFTLRDLTSYEKKHNEKNKEENRDGVSENYSYNHGHEGIEAGEEIDQKRIRTAKAMLATTLLAVGIPMITAGDEAGNSQFGNNNSYCHDNAIGHLQWEKAPRWKRELTDCIRQALDFRKKHVSYYPKSRAELKRNRRWYNPNGAEMTSDYWEQSFAKSVGLKVCSSKYGENSPLYFLFNASKTPVRFVAPENHRFEVLLFSTASEKSLSAQNPGAYIIEAEPHCFQIFRLSALSE